MKEIHFYNTLTKEKDLFKAIDEKEIKIYSCGPTVYHYAHLGNMRAYVFADILNNTLREAGYKVKHQINITDVGHLVSDSDEGEDKMEKGSAREGKSVWDIAEFYTQAFYSDLVDLNIDKEKFIWTKATDYIREQRDMIETLEEKGFTYKTSDGIYFDTSKFPRYTEFAHLDIEGMQKGKRIEDENNEKKNKSDFALWKFSPTNEKRQMEWVSAWGDGFPGWHIECSAMIKAVLGDHIDIHTGGIDHIPVHHTNEIAQSESVCDDGKRFVNFWMHVNFLNADKGKMSKSSDEFLRLETLKEKNINPLSYKYLLLSTHYRKEIRFSFESLEGANTGFIRLNKKIKEIKDSVENDFLSLIKNEELNDYKLTERGESYLEKFILDMHNDLNTASALGALIVMINDKELNTNDKCVIIHKMDKYFGLGLDKI